MASTAADKKRALIRSDMRGMMSMLNRSVRSSTPEESEKGPDGKRKSYYGPLSDSMVDTFEISMKCYLGHSETVNSYLLYKQTRMPVYERYKIPNLYAIILPGGHGKTWLSNEYGFIDVDNTVGTESCSFLYGVRNKLVASNTLEWVEHNRRWYSKINETLAMMTFDKPSLILVHSEECALEVGAEVLGAIVLNDAQFEENIMYRSRAGRLFSRVSKSLVVHRTDCTIYHAESNEEVEARVLHMCNETGIPVACPNKYGIVGRNPWYDPMVPRWLLEGHVRDKRHLTDTVINFEKRGWVPKECVDHFMRHNSPSGKAYGYGVTMNDWARVLANVSDSWNIPQNFDEDGDMFEIFPPRGDAERHRINVTLRRLGEEMAIWEDDDVYEIASSHVGESHVFVTGLVCHWLGLGKHLSIAEYIKPFYYVSEVEWTSVMKEIHNLIRLSNWYCSTPIEEEERQSIMYMDMLMGRKMYDADWKKVLEERRTDEGTHYVSFDPYRRIWSRSQYQEDFCQGLLEAYCRMFEQPKKVDVKSFPQFWKERRSWVAKGSTVLNQLPKDVLTYSIDFINRLDAKVESIRMRHNKKSLFESEEIIDLIQDTAESWNMTKAVPKLNETGKERELLPGTLLHYLIFSYVLWFAEKQRQIGSTRLNLNADDDIRNFDRKMMPHMHHMLYDWANFNAQHSIEDMAKVISWLKHIPGVPPDYRFYCDAIAESFYHMYLVNDDGEKFKLEKGLFSGWRGTTWINTVLNYVYVSVGIRSCCRIFKDFSVFYVDHGGDDLDITFGKPEDSFNMIDVMDAIGFEAKQIKQMVDSKSEFYRNTITTRGVFASPTRALANFISGNWETGGAKTLLEKTTSILDQVSKLERRGVDAEVCNAIGHASLRHWLKIKNEDEWIELKPAIIHGRVEDGGLGVPDREGRVWELDTPLTLESRGEYNFRLPGEYCASDFIEERVKMFAGINLKISDKKGLISKLAKQSYDLAQFQERANFAELNKLDPAVVGYHQVIEPKWDTAIYEAFLQWANTGGETLTMERLESWVEFLGHLEFNGMILTKRQVMNALYDMRLTLEAVEFKGDVYYRRLVPDFLANMIDAFVRKKGNDEAVSTEEMQEWFQTLCYMASKVYDHRA